MLRLLLLAVAVCVLSCATRTKYQPYGESGGYSEKRINNQVMATRFSGNAYTHKDDAVFFSRFRSLEICKEQGYRLVIPLGEEDQSSSKTVQQTSNFNYKAPTYFNANVNSNTVNGNIYGGNTYGHSTSWEQTLNFPSYDTYFMCANQAFSVGVELKPLSRDDLKSYVNDFMGGLHVLNLAPDSPNRHVLQPGDVILKVSGMRTQDLMQFIQNIANADNKDNVSIEILRNGKPLSLAVKAVETTIRGESRISEILTTACGIPEIKKRPICISRLPAGK